MATFFNLKLTPQYNIEKINNTNEDIWFEHNKKGKAEFRTAVDFL